MLLEKVAHGNIAQLHACDTAAATREPEHIDALTAKRH